MGSRWTHDLPDICEQAGLRWSVWPGWETRSRSTGGYDDILAIGVHHTASNASPDSDCSYMWGGSPDEPIGAVLLDRTGEVTIGAAGATNTQGKGGPYACSGGMIPLDSGNKFMFSIEAANGGTGEPWPDAQQDAYLVLCAALCDAWGLDPWFDVVAHFEWTDRKIDPAGNSRYANGGNKWNMQQFRNDVLAVSPTTPIPGPIPTPEDDDVPTLLLQPSDGDDGVRGTVFWWDGRQIGWVRNGIQVDVGTLTGVYVGKPPFTNFTAGMLQGMIDSGWAGGPVPPGFNPPTFVDSGV